MAENQSKIIPIIIVVVLIALAALAAYTFMNQTPKAADEKVKSSAEVSLYLQANVLPNANSGDISKLAIAENKISELKNSIADGPEKTKITQYLDSMQALVGVQKDLARAFASLDGIADICKEKSKFVSASDSVILAISKLEGLEANLKNSKNEIPEKAGEIELVLQDIALMKQKLSEQVNLINAQVKSC